MPMKPPTLCIGFGPHSDSGLAETGSYCPACKSRINQESNRRDADRRKRYGTDWDKFTGSLKAYGNVICQHVDLYTGVQCRDMAEITHHILAADTYPQFLLDWRNVVRVCRKHHPQTKGDDGKCLYIPTTWPISLGGNPPVTVCAGQRIPPGTEVWSLSSVRKRLLGA
jgi:hypothetical protein